MRKRDLLKRIEELETRVAELESALVDARGTQWVIVPPPYTPPADPYRVTWGPRWDNTPITTCLHPFGGKVS